MIKKQKILELVNSIIINSNNHISSTSIDIFEMKIIDSFAIVEIVTSLEKLFKVKIPFEEMTIQNFRSIDSMSSLLEKIKESK